MLKYFLLKLFEYKFIYGWATLRLRLIYTDCDFLFKIYPYNPYDFVFYINAPVCELLSKEYIDVCLKHEVTHINRIFDFKILDISKEEFIANKMQREV